MSAETVTLELDHGAGATRVSVGPRALEARSAPLAAELAGRTVFAVTSGRVAGLHGARLAPLAAAAGRWLELEVADGEAAKSLAVAGDLWRRMVSAGGKRDSLVVAFGGGSVGDLAGFVAGAFLRGIDYYQLPTTLLAQVDAALGGKTAVNLPEAKNSVGLFHHPREVVCDTALLATLERDELRSGLMEVIKIAAIHDAALLDRVERDLEPLLAGDAETLAPVVAAAAGAKIGIVARDPEERGLRRLLNFGHTLGHALEGTLGYRGLRHGDAVAYGMLFALRLALPRGLPATEAERLRRLLLRCRPPELEIPAPNALLELMRRDKKAREEGLTWVLPASLGAGATADDVADAEVLAALRAFADDPWAPFA